MLEGLIDLIQQRLLREKIAAGVRAQSQLGAGGVMRPLFVHLLQLPQMRSGVEAGISHTHLGYAHRYPGKAVRPHIEEITIVGRAHALVDTAYYNSLSGASLDP